VNQTNFATQPIAEPPTWHRVPEPADLTEIFDPAIQICTWQRELDPAIDEYLSALSQNEETQVIELLSTDAQPKLDFLPEKPGRAELIDDILFLNRVLNDLLGCQEVGIRFARIGHAMCPGWHFDRVGIRLICTYQGIGTQWLNDQQVDRGDLHSAQTAKSTYACAAPGEIVLLKGALWQGNEAFGAVHRSPELEPSAALRTLITLDPLWRD